MLPLLGLVLCTLRTLHRLQVFHPISLGVSILFLYANSVDEITKKGSFNSYFKSYLYFLLSYLNLLHIIIIITHSTDYEGFPLYDKE